MAVSIYFYLFLLLVTQLLSANILTFALKNKRKITVAGEGGRRSGGGREAEEEEEEVSTWKLRYFFLNVYRWSLWMRSKNVPDRKK